MKHLPAEACKKACVLLLSFFTFFSLHAQVTELYTDYGGYWKSGTGAINPVQPNNSHNVIAFKYNGTIYSTGVKDSALTNRGVSFTSAVFNAMPFTSVGGTIGSGSATYIALGTLYDGVTNGYGASMPSVKILDVVTDGINGLDIGTGVTNVPSSALFTYQIASIDPLTISDSKPDILFTQTAQPAGAGDSLYFVNSSGAIVGNRVYVGWTGVSSVGNYICDLYNLSNTSCDAAVITSGNSTNQVKELRLVGLQLSEFGITAANAASVVKLLIRPGGQSDPAFLAYNVNSLNVASPVITMQPVSQVVCPNTGQNATFTVTATGTSLSYQWKKDGVNIAGANSASYTITGVTASDAAMYEVTVSNAAGSITSQSVYLNTIITTQPSPVTQLIATGNSVTFSVSANNATGFQWKRNGTDISGATGASYTISTLTTTNGGTFTVNVVNAASGGCASLLSNAVVVNPSTTLYSKSSGALNVLSNWGVNSSGSGSRPVNFTRSEYVFKVVNQANATTGGDLTIGGTLDLVNSVTTITAGTVLSAGKIMSSGTGTLSGTTTSDLVVGNGSTLSFTAGAQVLKNLTVTSGSVSLNTDLSITAGSTPGVVTVSAGTFNTNNKLTLRSDASGTAAVGTSAGAINGEVTIERYIPAKRAWRLLTAPVTSTNAPTINAAWQEGATASDQDPAPGYGTHITGGAASDGFDQSPTNNTSIKYFNGSGWVAIGNTTGTAVNQHSGYMFFIRGNRAYDISSTLNSTTPLSTTLRVKGNLNQGTQVAKTVAATGYTLIGNPYASGIDFSQVYSSSINIKNRFRMWYPGLAGTNGVGGYVVVDWDGSGYTATPSVPVNSIIQSGEAFFVESNNGVSAGSLVVNESHKSNTTNNSLPFGRPAQSPDATIKMNLAIAETDGSLSVADGVLERYNDDYDDVVDGEDALKFNNSGENLAIVQNNQNLVIERRRLPKVTDTIILRVTNLVNSSYQFDISTSNFTGTGLLPLLHDAYLQQDKVLAVEGSTAYPFTVNADPESRAYDRFSIQYKNLNVLPLSFTGIHAVAAGKNSIRIEWSVENEFDSSQFCIEKLAASGDFLPIGTVAGRGGNIAGYQFTDVQPGGDNVYRIKCTGKTGGIKYSDMVQLSLAALPAQSLCAVYPNPVSDQVIHVSLNTAGKSSYRYKFVTLQGQVFETGKLVAGGGVEAVIQLSNRPVAGAYQLILSNGSESFRSVVLITEK